VEILIKQVAAFGRVVIATIMVLGSRPKSVAVAVTHSNRVEGEEATVMKKQILIVALVIVGSFTAGLAINRYRQSATATTINFNVTEYNDDGSIASTSKIVRVFSSSGEWSESQAFPNGQIKTARGKVEPDRLKIPADSPTAEVLGRPVVILNDRRSEFWYDPVLKDFTKRILYTDETRKHVQVVDEAVEIKQ
jgi:hypothetical protein